MHGNEAPMAIGDNLNLGRDRKEAEFYAKPLIERNAIRLSHLEREWAALGPLRPITFKVRLDDEDEARSFAAELEEKGFDVFYLFFQGVEGQENGISATLDMEPTTEVVTQWEEWLMKKASAWPPTDDNPDGAIFEGWQYPARHTPTFALEETRQKRLSAREQRQHSYWNHLLNARERTQILFGKTLAHDPVSNGKYSITNKETSFKSTFRLVPSEFLRKARDLRPESPEPTASSFAQWIYSLYADADGNSRDREEGIAAEEHILGARRRAYTSTDGKVIRSEFPDWKLIHNGLHMGQRNAPEYYRVSDLTVGGVPVRASPDLIYKNQNLQEVIIVEIKHSRMEIPNNLWPNIWGQLWCYSQLEQVRNASRITVVGEVWGDAWTRSRDEERVVCLRASVRRNPRAAQYDRFFRALFDIYRGII